MESAFWAVMHAVFPEEARKHLRAATREQLIAARVYLDRWIERLDEPAATGEPADTPAATAREDRGRIPMGAPQAGDTHRRRPEPPGLGSGHRAGRDGRVGRRGRVRLPRRLQRPDHRRLDDRVAGDPRLRERRPGHRSGRGRRGRAGRHAPGRPPRVRAGRLGLDGLHPRLRAAGRRLPRRLAEDHAPRPERPRRVLAGHPAAARALLRGARRRAGNRAALDDSAGPARRQHGHPPPRRRLDPLPAGLPRGSSLLDRRRARNAGRRRGLRHGHRDADAGARPPHACARTSTSPGRSSSLHPTRTPRSATGRGTPPTASAPT